MSQTVPATAVLGPGKTGLTIGVTVLNLDGTTYAAFSATGVAETSTAGTYRKAGGVVAPLAGGYIVWGTALVDYAEATVESASANVTMQQGVAVAAADANGNVSVVLYGTQGAVTFGQVKIVANVAGQGALDIRNSNAGGYGQLNTGQTGMYNGGVSAGVSNYGGNYGQLNEGTVLAVAGVDAPGVRTAIGLATANLDTQLAALPTDQDVRDAMKLAPTAGAPAAGSVDAKLDDILVDTGTTIPAAIAGIVGLAGSGAISFPITVQDEDSNPIDGVEVWITTDSAGSNVIAGTLSTDALGLATFMLDAGAYYVWRQKSGYNFTNPVTITVS